MKIKKKLALAVALVLAFALPSCAIPKAQSGDKAKRVSANALYRKADAPIEKRVEDLLSRMTLKEKIGQMTQIELGHAYQGSVREYCLGSVLSGGGAAPRINTPAGWADMIDSFQKEAASTRLGIPIIYGIDSVHGDNTLKNATIFPHNIGLGASGDTDLVRRIGEAVAMETSSTGIPWTFGPCVAVARDPRWGRTYESYGQDPALVTELGNAFIKGFQGAATGAAKPAACAKHFLGDGGTAWGTSTTDNYMIDQGDTRGGDAYLRNVLLPPYREAVKNGVLTVMVSFSSWNGVKMHAQKALVTDLLKGELGFTGFVVSDWAGMDEIGIARYSGGMKLNDEEYYRAMVTGINAGIDMNMVPYDAARFISTVEKAVGAKDISMERIDDAVRRIIRVKFEMGLFESPKTNRTLAAQVRSPEHLALAREAVAKSQVVLKNEGVLPLAKNAKKIYVAGNAADDIGIQCGGWTMTWQGKAGDITEGTTLLEAIKEKVPGAEIAYDASGNFASADRNSICVVALGERPYAEGKGDSADLALGASEIETLARAARQFDKVVLVIMSGRTVILGDAVNQSAAIVASWLPGTEGEGIADILFGDVKPTGKLSFAWPRSTKQLPLEKLISGEETPVWPAGYGLSW